MVSREDQLPHSGKSRGEEAPGPAGVVPKPGNSLEFTPQLDIAQRVF